MEEEKNLSLPENNSLIPQDIPDPEVIENPHIPLGLKPEDPLFATRILKQLEDSELAKVGEDLILQRIYLHDEGSSGGMSLKLSDINTGVEVIVTLSRIAKIKNIEELRELLEE